jgi:hypothetical protein
MPLDELFIARNELWTLILRIYADIRTWMSSLLTVYVQMDVITALINVHQHRCAVRISHELMLHNLDDELWSAISMSHTINTTVIDLLYATVCNSLWPGLRSSDLMLGNMTDSSRRFIIKPWVLYFLKCVNTSLHSCLLYKHRWLTDVVYVL